MSSKTQGKYQQHIESLKPKGSLPLLGAEGSINALSGRIYEGLNDDNADQSDPLVVGLYGEWGSGKSFWLKWIQYNVLKKHLDKGDTAQIIPVFFNAWRYEKEEHLIIPLLKSTAAAVKKHSTIKYGWKVRLEDAAKELLFSISSIAYHLAKKLDEDVLKSYVIGVLNDAKGSKETLDKRFRSKLERVQATTSELESQYFDFHQNVQAILKGDGNKPIRLLFLIDDLDRCLPEKAVEMLESIKLFLEMPGTAFVLAVDDEVVERGIAHRYRDYRFNANINGNNNTEKSTGNSDSPISGHEYLEKMIILPIRIDRAADSFVDAFIEQRCKPLNELKKALNKPQNQQQGLPLPAEADNSDIDQGTNERLASKDARDVFADLLQVIPSVPRKLLRLSELFQHRKTVLEGGDRAAEETDKEPNQHALSLTEQMALLRLLALQLFAPEVYRLAQRNGMYHIYTRLKETFKDGEVFAEYWPNYAVLHKKMQEISDEADTSIRARREREQVFLPVLSALSDIQQHRAGFDPGSFLDHWSPLELEKEGWARLFGHPKNKKKESEIAVSDQGGIELDQTDLEEIINQLTTTSPSGWSETIAKLPPGRLSDAHAEQLLTELKREVSGFDDTLKPQWIQTNGLILSAKKLKQAGSLLGLDAVLLDSEKQKKVCENNDASAEERLWAGDILGFLDTEAGIKKAS